MPDDSERFFFPPERSEATVVLIAGLLINSIALTLTWLTANYLIEGILCRNGNEGVCADPFTLSYNIFLILSALAATGWFAYSRIFRPALVTLPSAIMFWSLPVALTGIVSGSFLTFAIINVLLISFSYLVFYWLVRIRNFLIVFILWLVCTLALRMLLVAA